MDLTQYYALGVMLFSIIMVGKILIEIKKHSYSILKLFLLINLGTMIIQIIILYLKNVPLIVGQTIFLYTILNLVNLLCVIFYLLIFESFSKISPYSKRIMIIIAGFCILGTAILVCAIHLSSVISWDEYTNIGIMDENVQIKRLFFECMSGTFLLLSTALVLIICHFTWILHTSHKSRIQQIIKHHRIGVSIILITVIIQTFNIFFAEDSSKILSPVIQFLYSVGLIYLDVLYLKYGFYVFQQDILRRLLIIDQSGVLIFSYEFAEFELKDPHLNSSHLETPESVDDFIFSGALKAVSLILEEATGTMHQVKEIILDNMLLLVQSIIHTQMSVVLILDRHSHYYSNVLTTFIDHLSHAILHEPVKTQIQNELTSTFQSLVVNYFGK